MEAAALHGAVAEQDLSGRDREPG